MKASSIYGQAINRDLSPTNSKIVVHGEADLSRFGVFALETRNFSTYQGKVNRRYTLEVYELQPDGYPEMIECHHYKTVLGLKRAFKTFQIKELA